MATSAWSNEAWVTTEATDTPPAGGVLTYADANKFASPQGAGLHDGSSEANAWDRFEMCDNCQPGDVIGLAVGRYVGVQKVFDDATRFTPSFEPARSGTGSQPITFVAKNFAARTTDINVMSELCSGAPQGYNNDNVGAPAFGGYQKDHIHLIGAYLSTMRPDTGMAGDHGVLTYWGSTAPVVRYCRLEGDPNLGPNNYSAIRFEGILNGIVSDNLCTDWGQNNQGSIMKYYGATGCIFEHNEVYRCQTAINAKGWNWGLRNEDCDWRYNIMQDCTYGAMVLQAVVTGTQGQRNRFHNNLVLDSGDLAIIGEHPGGGMDQELYHGGGCDFYNNTYVGRFPVAGSQGLGIIYHLTSWQSSVGGGDNTFYNNICVGHEGLSGISWTSSNGVSLADGWADFNYNCYYQVPYAGVTWSGGGDLNQYPWSSWLALPQDAQSGFDDPLFENAGAGDYRLQLGSPCINSGQGNVTKGAYITGNETIGIR